MRAAGPGKPAAAVSASPCPGAGEGRGGDVVKGSAGPGDELDPAEDPARRRRRTPRPAPGPARAAPPPAGAGLGGRAVGGGQGAPGDQHAFGHPVRRAPRSGRALAAAPAAACAAVRDMATTTTCTPIRAVNSTPGNKTATGGASPRVSSRPVLGWDRLTVDELDSAKTSHIGKKSQLNDSVPMRGAGLSAGVGGRVRRRSGSGRGRWWPPPPGGVRRRGRGCRSRR